MTRYAGGKLQAVAEEEEQARPGSKQKAKVSRKERLQKKRDQKREAGSDNDDIETGESNTTCLYWWHILFQMTHLCEVLKMIVHSSLCWSCLPFALR